MIETKVKMRDKKVPEDWDRLVKGSAPNEVDKTFTVSNSFQSFQLENNADFEDHQLRHAHR